MRILDRDRQGKPVAGAARGRSPARHGKAGFTIVEVMVAVLVLVIAIVGIVGSMLSAMALNRVNRETAIAQQAARRMMEEISGVPFRDCYSLFNSEIGDYDGVAMPEFGPGFAVNGLQPQLGDADGLCGRIEFPEGDDGFGGLGLREDVVDPGLGMPQNLGGDPNLMDEDVSDNYRLLPVRVLVEWRGVSGNRSIELESMLSSR